MEDFFPPNMRDFLSDFNKRRNQELREMFKRYIKPSFMIRIKEEIINSPEFKNIVPTCYQIKFSTISGFGADDVDFDICSNLTMINWYLLLPINDEKKHEYYNDSNYIKDIKNRTVRQCQLRQLIQNFEERHFLLAHTPLNYSMHCVVNFLLSRINDNLQRNIRSTVPNANFKINSLIVMLKNIKSILLLTEIDNCGSAFSLLRALIESIFIYLAIYDNENAANEYYKFMEYRNKYESTGQYPQDFIDILPDGVQRQNYLNYGWLDYIKQKKRKYIFNEVLECSTKTSKNENDLYLATYKYCCKFSHGNYINQIIPKHSFIWIIERAGGILVNLARQFAYLFNEQVFYNGVDLEKYLIENIQEASKIFNKLNANIE